MINNIKIATLKYIKHPVIVGHGEEGTIYKHGGLSYKEYNRNTRKYMMDTESLKLLSALPLRAFAKPKEAKEKGYTYDYIQNQPQTNFVDLEVPLIIDFIKSVEQDVLVLSSNGFEIIDLKRANMLISKDENKPILIDCLKRVESDNCASNQHALLKRNKNEIESFFLSILLQNEMLSNPDNQDSILRRVYSFFKDYYRKRYTSIAEYFDNELQKGLNIREHIVSRK